MAGPGVLPLRIAVALSGGVDSAVAALLLRRCVHTEADVEALRCFGTTTAPPPTLSSLKAAVDAGTSLCHLLPHRTQAQLRAAAAVNGTCRPVVEYYPFYIRSWYDMDAPHGWCERSQRDYHDAQRVAHALQLLPCTTSLPILDFAQEYAAQCFQRMLHAYAAGHTLNVDVLCNEHIKFGAVTRALQVVQAFSPAADKERGQPQEQQQQLQRRTLLATGHYARTWCMPTSSASAQQPPALLLQPCSAVHDLNDQTHFLARVSPCTLAGALFPLGHLFRSKADVRAVAQRHLSADSSVSHIASKRTSTGICFVGPPPASAARRDVNVTEESRKRGDTCAAASPCSARFAAFLNDYLPPPPSHASPSLLSSPSLAPSCTIFREATTRAEKALAKDSAVIQGLRNDYPAHLPAYALTLGQRLRLCDLPGTDGSCAGRMQTYYVAHKSLLPASSSSEPGAVRLLAEVLVVDRWDHPLLYATHVSAVSLRWWLPADAVRRAACCPDGRHYTLSCLCAVRHQATPQPATIRWCKTSEVDEEEAATACGVGLCVRCCTLCFDAPVRAPTAGQAVVAYLSLSAVTRLVTALSGPTASPTSALAVIGAAWVGAVDEEA